MMVNLIGRVLSSIGQPKNHGRSVVCTRTYIRVYASMDAHATITYLIEMANKNDDTAAFVCLDQKKAFDRVNHDFLFKTMKAFEIGENLINWVKTIYSNASSVLNIKGFFSQPIP